MQQQNPPQPDENSPPLTRIALEMWPLLVFFIVNFYGPTLFGIPPASRLFWATGAFMVAVFVALVLSYILYRHIAVMAALSGVVVGIFGGLTLILQDELYIKLKPTIVNALFALALFGGLALRRNVLAFLFGAVFPLDAAGWRALTIRWGLFFIALALLNEIVWRTQSTDAWVNYKVWVALPLTLVFAAAQTPLILRHSPKSDED